MLNCVWILFFFFQAEDGIRDRLVTGVQTCALPISDVFVENETVTVIGENLTMEADTVLNAEGKYVIPRSEERRVGKECRSRWSPYH